MDIVSIVAIVTAAGAIIIGIFNHVQHSACCGKLIEIDTFDTQPQPQPTRIIEIVEPEPYTYSVQQPNEQPHHQHHHQPPTRPYYTQYDMTAHMKYK